MSTILLFDFGSGLAMLAVAWIFGWSLFRFSRRHPESVFANDSVVADMVCVGEVFLIAFGIMFLARGLTVLV